MLGTSELSGSMDFVKHHLDELQAVTNENMGRRIWKWKQRREWKSRGFGGSEGVQMDKLAPVTTQR